MTQGLTQYPQVAKKRCSERRTRPPLETFPPYLNEHFATIGYNFTDHNLIPQNGLMGNRMEVILLPRAFDVPGSAPGRDQLEPITSFLRGVEEYRNYNFIKGHMWNQEVGGQGVTENLVPLTAQANSAHKNNAETPLKNALLNFANFYNRNQPNHQDYAMVYGFKYVVEIEGNNGGFTPWPRVRERIVPNAIHVQVFRCKCNAQRIVIFDDGDPTLLANINIAISDEGTRGQINALIKGIWIDQDGVIAIDA